MRSDLFADNTGIPIAESPPQDFFLGITFVYVRIFFSHQYTVGKVPDIGELMQVSFTLDVSFDPTQWYIFKYNS